MKLPLRHAPPQVAPPLCRCAHLEALAEAARGLALGSAVREHGRAKSRGRYGNALQWHLGLAPHDSEARLDWEDRIELKMVSVWATKAGEVRCDKLKVCEASVDPWHKLSNVLWVFVDRVTRVVLGHRFTHLSGDLLYGLRESWAADPHFDRPSLFVESRESADGSSSPAYYLSAEWFLRVGLLDGLRPLHFDAAGWSALRRSHNSRDPALSLISPSIGSPAACPRCDGALHFQADELRTQGWAAAAHASSQDGRCALRGHLLVDPSGIVSSRSSSREEQYEAIEGRETTESLWRLADRVGEPEDHLH